MRYSEMLLPTTREVPSDAEIASHQLMLRAGMIRKLAGGVYSYLPLGYRTIRKIENIIREEMDRAGAQEIFMPAVQPAELWQESGRWDKYGKELLRFRDRHNRDYCFGPTHEEVVTDIMRNEIQTYRQLPKNLYQIQTKFRDEIRPRFGVMRSREFIMKDAYSFDADEEAAEKSYDIMFEAYERIFSRCGMIFRAVEADTGAIGGSYSHEFLVTADSGEDAMVYCTSCNYAANLEKAEVAAPEEKPVPEQDMLPAEEVHTPDVRTIEEVSAFIGVSPRDIVKTLIFNADGKTVAVLVRGDEDINETKLKNYLGAGSLEMAADDEIMKVTGSPRGFAGPRGIRCSLIADYSIMNMKNFVVGANREDYHVKNCNLGRDVAIPAYADLRTVRKGDRCPRCGGEISFARGIEVGHVFKLGTKYSTAMNAVFLDRDGKEKLMIMGCYGIGVSRIAAAAIEQSHDDDGIIWPMSLAPFQVIITAVNMGDDELSQAAENLYNELVEAGVEVLFDDRDERAGVKFKDADLLGIPLRITVGAKRLAEGNIEVRFRKTGEVRVIPLSEATEFIRSTVDEETHKIMA
ncbi:MAG: proline--tRNA ligase [delta proteobacterium MLS_D]|jgi:prolyl-tRNA synthetase|nr:MAG: proline--tRNA ligase [delta proteobacterium MLS_D]